MKNVTASTVAVPTIRTACTSNGTKLYVGNPNALYTYQWTLGGTPIPGATGSTFTTAANGNYTVVATSNYGCTATSAGRTLPVTAGTSGIRNGYCNYPYGLIGDVLPLTTAANAAKYSVRIENNNNPGVTVGRAVANGAALSLQAVTPALQYGQTYKTFVTVITANNDTLCENTAGACSFITVPQAAANPTKLASSFCGKLNLVNNTGNINAISQPAADQYVFHFRNIVTNAVTNYTSANTPVVALANLGLASGTTYSVKVDVRRDNVVTYAVDSCLLGFQSNGGGSRIEGSIASELVAYPNPTASNATLSFTLENAANVAVVLTDLAGRTVNNTTATGMTAGNQTIALNTEALNAGVYVARLMVNGTLAGQVRLNVVK
jgi:hypothetical protein